MIERTDHLFTLITGQDLHDHEFHLAWYHGNSHLDLTIPLDHHSRRSLHLGRHQARALALKLLDLTQRMPLTDPAARHDYQI